MMPGERLQAERDKVVAETGFYVPPYRMANLMKAAARIMEILTRADTNICYKECEIVLKIVSSAVSDALGGKEDGNVKDTLEGRCE
jgi:hypothetical protein